MTNILSVGIVYDNSFSKAEELQNLMDYMLKLKAEPFEYKVSIDLEGENWIEGFLDNHSNKLNHKLITENYYGEIKIRFNKFCDIKELTFVIRFIEQKGFFGFLLEFDLEILLEIFSLNEMDALIIKFSENLYTFTNYNYVFSDHDSEVDYSPYDDKEYINAYSLVVLPIENQSFSVIKNKWHLDGFTKRTFN
ncbi:hypothetical protein HNQ44_000184 [Planomicrobium koreense]|uniref:Uncharacterized protein n=1 Tax=Planococcus koreensis TaxID=112331 RepID=A0A7W8FTH8_9BACL|nr:Imm64 family immunity protein [Planococcus koreensis]MBB5178762.1 hypothetical protein [Planococcus koreensis]